MSDKSFKLCYVANNILYFTDNFEKQWGDDWDDAPYEYNAEPPYEIIPELEDNSYRGNIRCIAVMDLDAEEPCDGYLNSVYSVKDINQGVVPWLRTYKYGNLMAGTTIEEAIAWLKKTKCRWGELKAE